MSSVPSRGGAQAGAKPKSVLDAADEGYVSAEDEDFKPDEAHFVEDAEDRAALSTLVEEDGVTAQAVVKAIAAKPTPVQQKKKKVLPPLAPRPTTDDVFKSMETADEALVGSKKRARVEDGTDDPQLWEQIRRGGNVAKKKAGTGTSGGGGGDKTKTVKKKKKSKQLTGAPVTGLVASLLGKKKSSGSSSKKKAATGKTMVKVVKKTKAKKAAAGLVGAMLASGGGDPFAAPSAPATSGGGAGGGGGAAAATDAAAAATTAADDATLAAPRQKARRQIAAPTAAELAAVAAARATVASSKLAVTETVKFAGKESTITKFVNASAEAAKTGAKPGLDALVSNLGKTQDVSTIAKSSHDWDSFKVKEGIEHQLEQYTKDGYVEKQDFLKRVDERQYENEKAERAVKRAARDLASAGRK